MLEENLGKNHLEKVNFSYPTCFLFSNEKHRQTQLFHLLALNQLLFLSISLSLPLLISCFNLMVDVNDTASLKLMVLQHRHVFGTSGNCVGAQIAVANQKLLERKINKNKSFHFPCFSSTFSTIPTSSCNYSLPWKPLLTVYM